MAEETKGVETTETTTEEVKTEETVETPETTETVETTETTEEVIDDEEKGFFENLLDDEEETTDDTTETETETETDTEVETETEEGKEENKIETGDLDPKFQLKDGEVLKDLDITKPEDRSLLLQYANKGMNYEGKVQKLNEEGALLEDVSQALALQRFRNENLLKKKTGEYSEDFTLPERDDFVTEDEYNTAKAKVEKNIAALTEYNGGFAKMQTNFVAMVKDFKGKHPEMTDEQVNEWITETVTPYAKPYEDFGYSSHPSDALDMIWHWKNKDKYDAEWQKKVDNAGAEAIAKLASQPVKKHTGTTGASTTTTNNGKEKSAVEKEIDRILPI